jgi:RNA polymerase sigma-70 factor (family 1)
LKLGTLRFIPTALTKSEFKSCFDQLFDPVRNYLFYRSRDTELATDLTQEVFLKLWEKQIPFDPKQTKALLYKMAGDLFISHIRRTKVADKYVNSIGFNFEEQDPQSQLQYQELKAKYEQILSELPEKQRTVFLMNRTEELSYKEIAERLEISVKAVEKRMSKALSVLRNSLPTT